MRPSCGMPCVVRDAGRIDFPGLISSLPVRSGVGSGQGHDGWFGPSGGIGGGGNRENRQDGDSREPAGKKSRMDSASAAAPGARTSTEKASASSGRDALELERRNTQLTAEICALKQHVASLQASLQLKTSENENLRLQLKRCNTAEPAAQPGGTGPAGGHNARNMSSDSSAVRSVVRVEG